MTVSVIGALQADSTLPFEMWKLVELVQMARTLWIRHPEWVLRGLQAKEHRCDEQNSFVCASGKGHLHTICTLLL